MRLFSLPARHAVLGVCVLVWLMLVPLQSWAQTVMPFMGAASAAAVDMPPCHDPEQPDPQAACHDCALCHWLAAPVPLALPDTPAPALRCWTVGLEPTPPCMATPPPRRPPRA